MSEKKYGKLLDKFVEEGRGQSHGERYGSLLKNVNSDKSRLDAWDGLGRFESVRDERRAEEAEEDRKIQIERAKRIEDRNREREDRLAKNNAFVDGYLEKKRNEQEARDREQKKKSEEEKMIESIATLIDTAPNVADAYANVMAKIGR